MTQVLDAHLLTDHAAPGRECGPCTACCATLAIVELNKPARRACDHLCRAGCGIYETRPASCREFHCLWLRGAIDGDEALRPDALGVMFDFFRMSSTGAMERPSPYLRFSIARFTAAPMSAGLSATSMPASLRAAIFSSAVPLPPEMIAPA